MPDMSEADSQSGSIALIAGIYPALSETFVYRDVQGLRQAGWQVVTVTLRTPDEPVAGVAPADLTVYGSGGVMRSRRPDVMAVRDMLWPGETMALKNRLKLLIQARAGRALAQVLVQRGVQHIHAHFAHAPTTVAMYAAQAMGITFSFTGHANDLFQRRALLKRKLQRAAFVNCISHWHRQYYRETIDRPDTHYPVVRCGVAMSNHPPQPAEPAADHDPLKLLSVGRMVPKKGFDTALHAMAQLRAQHPQTPMHLTIIGDGPDLPRLQQIIADHDLSRHVTLAGALPNEQVQRQMAEADLFVLPCRPDEHGDRDGIPVVLMEAMAKRKAVITGDLPAIRELVIHETTGLLVDGTDVSATADAMRRLGDDASLRLQLAHEAAEHVRAEFSQHVNIQRFSNVLEATCKSASC